MLAVHAVSLSEFDNRTDDNILVQPFDPLYTCKQKLVNFCGVYLTYASKIRSKQLCASVAKWLRSWLYDQNDLSVGCSKPDFDKIFIYKQFRIHSK